MTWLLVWASLLKATTTVLVGSSGFAMELSNSNQMGEWAIGKKRWRCEGLSKLSEVADGICRL